MQIIYHYGCNNKRVRKRHCWEMASIRNQEIVLSLGLLLLITLQQTFYHNSEGWIPTRTFITLILLWITVCFCTVILNARNERQSQKLSEELKTAKSDLDESHDQHKKEIAMAKKTMDSHTNNSQHEIESLKQETTELKNALSEEMGKSKLACASLQQENCLAEKRLEEEHEIKLARVRDKYHSEKSGMQKDIDCKQDELEKLRKMHKTQKARVESIHAAEVSRLNRKITQITDDSDRKVREHNEEVEKIRRAHRSSENVLRNKHKLELKEVTESHQMAIEKLELELKACKTVKQKLTRKLHDTQIQQTENVSRERLSALNRGAAQQEQALSIHKSEIESLRRDFEAKFDSLQEQHRREKVQLTRELREEHNRVIDEMRKDKDRHIKDLQHSQEKVLEHKKEAMSMFLKWMPESSSIPSSEPLSIPAITYNSATSSSD